MPPALQFGNIDVMAVPLTYAVDPGLHLENCNY